MSKRKSIVRQAQEALTKQAAFGHSKHNERKENGGKIPAGRIYSKSTMTNYIQSATYFAKWARDQHGCKTIEDAERYAGDFLQERIDAGKSSWTVARDASALGKMYGRESSSFVTSGDGGHTVKIPTRYRSTVTQHRNQETVDGHFSESRNADLVALARSCGLRRREIASLKPEDVSAKNGKVMVYTIGKNGKERTVEALDDTPLRLAREAIAEGRSSIVEHFPKRTPFHVYRREYAQELYARIARPVETLDRSEQYRCRGDLQGYVFDKAAMAVVSGNLGHARLEVVTHYLV